MPCENALIRDVITCSPDTKIEDALNIIETRNIRGMPVLDDKGAYLGLFGVRAIMLSLLPGSYKAGGLDTLDFAFGASPDIAEKLKALTNKTVGEIMETDIPTVTPETATLEGIRLLVKHGSPIAVLDKKTKAFLGIITKQSAIHDLKNNFDDLLCN